MHKTALDRWQLRNREMGVWWPKYTRQSAKTGNKKLPSCNLLWFWVVPRQNKEKWGHSLTHVWKCPCANFSEHWLHAWAYAHAQKGLCTIKIWYALHPCLLNAWKLELFGFAEVDIEIPEPPVWRNAPLLHQTDEAVPSSNRWSHTSTHKGLLTVHQQK